MNRIIKYGGCIWLWLLFLFFTEESAFGQHDNTFFLMQAVPQTNLLNPAVQPACRWYVGIPGLASTHLYLGNSAFSYRELAEGDTWRLHEIADQTHRSDFIGAEATLNPVSLGYRYRSLYFSFNIGERAHFYQAIPGDLTRVVLSGNGDFVGETAHFGGLRSSAAYFREYSVAVSRRMDSRWTVGLRAALLFGKAALHTGQSDVNLSTDRYSFNLLFEGDYLINASMPVTLEQDAGGNISNISVDDPDYAAWLLNRSNPGVSFDLGIIYRYDDRTTFSASLLDLGIMRWRSDVHNVDLNGSFTFSGVEPGTDFVSLTFLQELGDSVVNAFDQSVSHRAFTAFTPVQAYLGGSYRLKENLTVGIVQHNLLLRSKWHASLTLLAQADLNDRFLFSVSWSAMNNSIRNLGAGVAYHGKGFQFHLVSDNITGFFFPFDTRTVNLRAGCNILFGCPRNKGGEQADGSYGYLPSAADCSWTGKSRNMKRLMEKARKKQNKL